MKMKKQKHQTTTPTTHTTRPPPDFTGRHVFYANAGTILTLGTVTGQAMRGRWLYLRIQWEDDSCTDMSQWQKAANVGIFDKNELSSRLQKL